MEKCLKCWRLPSVHSFDNGQTDVTEPMQIKSTAFIAQYFVLSLCMLWHSLQKLHSSVQWDMLPYTASHESFHTQPGRCAVEIQTGTKPQRTYGQSSFISRCQASPAMWLYSSDNILPVTPSTTLWHVITIIIIRWFVTFCNVAIQAVINVGFKRWRSSYSLTSGHT